MHSFFDIFADITGHKTHDMNYIMKHYNLTDDYMENQVMLGDVLNIYLTINGFRDTCLESGLNNVTEDKRKILEKKYNIHIVPTANSFLISTKKNKKILLDLSEKYEKHIYGKTKKTKESDKTNLEMGEILDYIEPRITTGGKKDPYLGGMEFIITYNGENVTHDIYRNSIHIDDLTPKDYKKIFDKYKKMSDLLDKISPKFKVTMTILNKLW